VPCGSPAGRGGGRRHRGVGKGGEAGGWGHRELVVDLERPVYDQPAVGAAEERGGGAQQAKRGGPGGDVAEVDGVDEGGAAGMRGEGRGESGTVGGGGGDVEAERWQEVGQARLAAAGGGGGGDAARWGRWGGCGGSRRLAHAM
jgi:hypothetical protein